MTQLRERIISAAYPLLLERGVRGVTEGQVQSAAGVGPLEFSEEFASWEEVAGECLAKRQREWTVGLVEAGVRDLSTTPEGKLLAIFDILGEWFQRADYEACTFVKVLMEVGKEHSLGQASIAYLLGVRRIVADLALEAQLRDVDEFASSWDILMKGAIISALEGDPKAAARAKSMAKDLIARHRALLSFAVSRPSEPADLNTFDDWELLEEETDGPTTITFINSLAERRSFSAHFVDRYDDRSDYAHAV